jgi:hypothetical protein
MLAKLLSLGRLFFEQEFCLTRSRRRGGSACSRLACGYGLNDSAAGEARAKIFSIEGGL